MPAEAILDDAVCDYVAAVSEREGQDRGPVLAWVAIAVVDDAGDEDPAFIVAVPDGQRGVLTRGILLDALDACRVRPAPPSE